MAGSLLILPPREVQLATTGALADSGALPRYRAPLLIPRQVTLRCVLSAEIAGLPQLVVECSRDQPVVLVRTYRLPFVALPT